MSEWKPRVVQVGPINDLPNSDTLAITDVEGYPCIVRRGEFTEGQLASYLPIDTIVPPLPEWDFLKPRDYRIKAIRLRGTFSMGLLTNLGVLRTAMVGDSVVEILHLRKHLTADEREDLGIVVHGGVSFGVSKGASGPKCDAPIFTDLESARKWRKKLQEWEDTKTEVVVSCKIHGSSWRSCYVDGTLHVGSHRRWVKEHLTNMWWYPVEKYGLKEKLAKYPDLVFYGEVYGNQDLKYGIEGKDELGRSKFDLVLFDIRDSKTGKYLDYSEARKIADDIRVPWAPILYIGPWHSGLLELSEGQSMIPGANHVREGFVVKPLTERRDDKLGREILKFVGQGYLLRKGG